MKKNAFSLVELVVGITISMILMVWVGIFVGGWISNLTLQEKVLNNISDFNSFSKQLYSWFSRVDTSVPAILTNSWVILKQKKRLW